MLATAVCRNVEKEKLNCFVSWGVPGANILACGGQKVGVIPEMQILSMMSPDALLVTQEPP